MIKTKISAFLKLFMAMFGFGGTVIFSMVFYTAYFNPNYSVIVYVNRHNEAWIEAHLFTPLFLIFTGILMVWLLVNWIREVLK